MSPWILPLTILITFEIIADILAKKWSLSGPWYMAGLALLAYMAANTFWLFALKNGSGLGRGAVLFSVASAVLAIIVGVILYHEEVSSLQIAGMALGIVAIALIYWE